MHQAEALRLADDLFPNEAFSDLQKEFAENRDESTE